MHSNWLHLLLNCWALFLLGREVEWQLGKPRFLLLYFLSGIVGGLFHLLVAFLWPHYFDVPVVGASAGVAGVVAVFAMLYPDRRMTLLLFFVIPVNLRAKSLLWLMLMITALGIAFPTMLGLHIAHAAHLGGILTGLAFSRFYAPRWSGA
jgi:membrane associated rhomboid family serine protease